MPGTTTSRGSAMPSTVAATTSSRPAAARRSRPGVPANLGRLDRLAELAAARDVALEINGSDLGAYAGLVQLLCESIARAGAPVSLGSDAHRPHRVGVVLSGLDSCARRVCAVRLRSSAASGATTGFESGPRAACRCSRSAWACSSFLPDDGGRAARLRAGHCHARAFARRAEQSSRWPPAGRFGGCTGRFAASRCRGVRPRGAVVAARVRDGARGWRDTGPRARPRADRDWARRQHRGPGARWGRLSSRVRHRIGGRGRDRRLRERRAPGRPCRAARRARRRRHDVLGVQRVPAPDGRRCRPPRSCAWHLPEGPSRCCRSSRSRWLAATPFRQLTPVPSRRWHSPRSQRPDSVARRAAVLSRVRAAVAASASTWSRSAERSPRHVGLDEPLYARHAVGALIVIAAIWPLGPLRREL